MSFEKANPLDPMRKATEEDYFRKQNAELAAKLKARMEMEKAGVHDQALADSLLAAGFSEDSVRALYLVPIIDIAWADGRLQDEEKAVIMTVAEARGIKKDSAAYTMISGWLKARPTDDSFVRGKTLCEALLGDLQSGQGNWILDAANKVAAATGGLFGFGSKISSEEEAALKKLGEKLKK